MTNKLESLRDIDTSAVFANYLITRIAAEIRTNSREELLSDEDFVNDIIRALYTFPNDIGEISAVSATLASQNLTESLQIVSEAVKASPEYDTDPGYMKRMIMNAFAEVGRNLEAKEIADELTDQVSEGIDPLKFDNTEFAQLWVPAVADAVKVYTVGGYTDRAKSLADNFLNQAKEWGEDTFSQETQRIIRKIENALNL